MQLAKLTLTLLFDNVACDERLDCLWGFSCLVTTPKTKLLFDSGSNGRILLRNMRTLGLDPAELDCLFISHGHWDHIGGLDSLLELNPDLELVLPANLSPRLVADLKTMCRKVSLVGDQPQTFVADLASTGTLSGDVPEQALVIDSDMGPVVITGCAHPGIARIAERASRQAGQAIALLAGGYHLYDATAADVDRVADRLHALGVRYILPTHCTGEAATRRLGQRFGDGFVTGGAGQVVRFDSDGRPVANVTCQDALPPT